MPRKKLTAEQKAQILTLKAQRDLTRAMSNNKVEIKGPKGDKGDRGAVGPQGETGAQGVPGKDGSNGKDGKSGKDGAKGKDGKAGNDGKAGKDGKNSSPDSPKEIRNKLESLEGNLRLDASAISNLNTAFKPELKNLEDLFNAQMSKMPSGFTNKQGIEALDDGIKVGSFHTVDFVSSGSLRSEQGILKVPLTGGGGGGGNPGTPLNSIQYNDNGSFGGDSSWAISTPGTLKADSSGTLLMTGNTGPIVGNGEATGGYKMMIANSADPSIFGYDIDDKQWYLDNRLRVSESFDVSTSSDSERSEFDTTLMSSSDTSDNYYALRSRLTWLNSDNMTAADVQGSAGFISSFRHEGSGNITSAMGSIGFVETTKGGSVDLAAGVVGAVLATDNFNSKIVTGAAFRAFSLVNTGQIDNVYGMYIKDGDLAGTANYGLYFEQDAPSYHEGQMLVGDGTAAAPTYSFNNDTDSGLFSVANGIVGYSGNGISRFTFNTLGMTSTGSGFHIARNNNESLPIYSHVGDTSDGMYFPSNNHIGWSVAGQKTMELDNNELTLFETAGNSLSSVRIHADVDSRLFFYEGGFQNGRIVGKGTTNSFNIDSNRGVLYLNSEENKDVIIGAAGGDTGIGLDVGDDPARKLQVSQSSVSSGATTFSATSGTSTFTTSVSITLQEGTLIIPDSDPTKVRTVKATATGTSFTIDSTWGATFVADTFTMNEIVTARVQNGMEFDVGDGAVVGFLRASSELNDTGFLLAGGRNNTTGASIDMYGINYTANPGQMYLSTGGEGTDTGFLQIRHHDGTTYQNHARYDKDGQYRLGSGTPSAFLDIVSPGTSDADGIRINSADGDSRVGNIYMDTNGQLTLQNDNDNVTIDADELQISGTTLLNVNSTAGSRHNDTYPARFGTNSDYSILYSSANDSLQIVDGMSPDTNVRFELFSTGAVSLDEYGDGTFTGTATYGLGVDTDGNIIETGIPIVEGGALTLAYAAKTANYTVTADDHIIHCTANTFTVTLPTAVGIAGRIYSIKNTGGGAITIATTGAETIDGSATSSLGNNSNQRLASDGANWIILY